MMSPEDAKRGAHQLALAVAPVVGIAHRCRDTDLEGVDLVVTREILAASGRYFNGEGKGELAEGIKRLSESLDTGVDVRLRAEEVLEQVAHAYPNKDAPTVTSD